MNSFIDRITTGDAFKLSEQIPDESIDLIFTDPIYEDTSQYLWLSHLADRVLKPDRAALVWSGVGHLDKVIEALSARLLYKWTFVWYKSNNRLIYYHLYNKWSPLLWFDKGKSNPTRIQDLRNQPLSYGRDRQDNLHEWAKRNEIISYYLEAFTKPGDLVLDPFCGAAVVAHECKKSGRHFISFEIDEARAQVAQKRLDHTQEPLLIIGGNDHEDQATIPGLL